MGSPRIPVLSRMNPIRILIAHFLNKEYINNQIKTKFTELLLDVIADTYWPIWVTLLFC
jgi:hypothetical protein